MAHLPFRTSPWDGQFASLEPGGLRYRSGRNFKVITLSPDQSRVPTDRTLMSISGLAGSSLPLEAMGPWISWLVLERLEGRSAASRYTRCSGVIRSILTKGICGHCSITWNTFRVVFASTLSYEQPEPHCLTARSDCRNITTLQSVSPTPNKPQKSPVWTNRPQGLFVWDRAESAKGYPKRTAGPIW